MLIRGAFRDVPENPYWYGACGTILKLATERVVTASGRSVSQHYLAETKRKYPFDNISSR